jgi:Transposase DDE domain
MTKCYVCAMSTKSHKTYRKEITLDKEISELRTIFQGVEDNRASNASHKLDDILMCGYAMFSLKYTSLLDFEQQTFVEKSNLMSVFGIEKVCSDVQLRAVLDKIDPSFVRNLFPQKFATLRKTGLLDEFGYKIGGVIHHIVACDGVQHFSSKKNGCTCCLTKEHKDGSCTYYHSMLCATLVHPAKREVFMMDVEPIIQQDGVEKNDCERNAAKRLQANMKNAYQKYQKQYNFLFVEDALYANAPHIEQLMANQFNYILNIKPDSHKTLFKYIAGKRARKELKTYATTTQDGIKHQFEYINNVLLCSSSPKLRVNFIQYTQTDKNGKKTTFTWVTDIKLAENKLIALMKAGRARWKVENETFNTLKNLGYNFEHNYGHGKDHLSTMFAYLMLLAFYIDQLIQACCHIFQQIEENIKTKIKLWSTIKSIFQTTFVNSVYDIYQYLATLFEFKILNF